MIMIASILSPLCDHDCKHIWFRFLQVKPISTPSTTKPHISHICKLTNKRLKTDSTSLVNMGATLNVGDWTIELLSSARLKQRMKLGDSNIPNFLIHPGVNYGVILR